MPKSEGGILVFRPDLSFTSEQCFLTVLLPTKEINIFNAFVKYILHTFSFSNHKFK